MCPRCSTPPSRAHSRGSPASSFENQFTIREPITPAGFPGEGDAEAPVVARRDGGVKTGGGIRVRAGSGVGAARPGPFIVEERDCTVVVPPGWSASLDERCYILMSRSDRRGDDES